MGAECTRKTVSVSPAEKLEQYAALTDSELERWLRPAPSIPDRLLAAMRHAMFPGGKRLRPILLLATAEALGTAATRGAGPAAAVEMVHSYSLVHDDLPCMDNDDFRRGRPTVHRVYGEATALLAGDALLTLAFEVLASSGEAQARRLVGELAAAIGPAGMVGGQAQELLSQGKLDRDGLLAVHAGKTGALIRAAVRMGAVVAGAAPASSELAHLTTFAENLGLAFQVTDDLLDLPRDEAAGRTTLATILGEDGARRMAEEVNAAAVGALDFLGPRAGTLRCLADQQLSRRS